MLKTTDPDAKLPKALKDTYEDTSDYIEKNQEEIYATLMKLIDSTAKTDKQKQILTNVMDKILEDGKMIVCVENPESQDQISYKTIEKETGIKLNPGAITLLTSFANTYLYSKVEDKHSIFIDTNRKIAKTILEIDSDKAEEIRKGRMTVEDAVREGIPHEVYEWYAEKILKDKKQDKNIPSIYICKKNKYIEVEKPEDLSLETRVYDRYVDGEMLSEPLSQEDIQEFRKLRKNRTIIDKPITTYEELKDILKETEKENGFLSEKLEVLVNSRIKQILNNNRFGEEEKSNVNQFISEKCSVDLPRYILTPKSLYTKKEREENPDVNKLLCEISKKVPGLSECIEEIISNFNSGTAFSNISIREGFKNGNGNRRLSLSEKYESILIQAVNKGQINAHDYLDCMEGMQCIQEVSNKFKLSPQEALKYVYKVNGVEQSSSEIDNAEQGKEYDD